jgi:hypothetical protein
MTILIPSSDKMLREHCRSGLCRSVNLFVIILFDFERSLNAAHQSLSRAPAAEHSTSRFAVNLPYCNVHARCSFFYRGLKPDLDSVMQPSLTPVSEQHKFINAVAEPSRHIVHWAPGTTCNSRHWLSIIAQKDRSSIFLLPCSD